jgi:hypothetical protein
MGGNWLGGNRVGRELGWEGTGLGGNRVGRELGGWELGGRELGAIHSVQFAIRIHILAHSLL